MKIISLNTWAGNAFESLAAFLQEQSTTTDVFCLQEMWSSENPGLSRGTHLSLYEKITLLLKGHQGFFFPIQDGIDEQGPAPVAATMGHAIFVRKGIQVLGHGFRFVLGGRNSLVGGDWESIGWGFSFVTIDSHGEPLTVVSVHGISLPGDKLDTPARLVQSQKIKAFLDETPGKKILCGDFNLLPETASIQIFEGSMKNLIKNFNIPTTRSTAHNTRYPNNPQYFADFTFVSPDITVESFEVPDIPVSDHLPMILRFS